MLLRGDVRSYGRRVGLQVVRAVAGSREEGSGARSAAAGVLLRGQERAG